MPKYKIIKGGEKYPIHIVDEFGIPNIELMLYFKTIENNYSPKTIQTYLRELVSFINWSETDGIAVRQGWNFMGHNLEVRELVSYFLKTQLKCSLQVRDDKLGFEVQIIKRTQLAPKKSLNHLLAALTSFYRVMKKANLYHYENPMIGDNAKALIQAERYKKIATFKEVIGRSPMPAASGVDSFQTQRLSAAYFRINGRNEWRPTIISDPLLQQSVLSAGESWGWNIREFALVHILFDTGCRVHEACEITIGDWQHSHFGREIRAINKGSFGVRTKNLYLSDRTVKILRKYVDTERYVVDKHGRKLRDLMNMPAPMAHETPLFLTSINTRFSEDYFRSHFWSPALLKAGIKLRIHQIRHWYVTMAIKNLKDISKSEEELEKNRHILRLLMSWKSDMLSVYDHSIQYADLPNFANQLHNKMEEKIKSENLITQKTKKSDSKDQDSEMTLMLNEMLWSN